MRAHVDWLTFTLPMWFSTREDSSYEESIEYAFVSTFDAKTLSGVFGGEWELQERSRAPYTNAWAMEDCGITRVASQSLNHACVEISGKGCERVIREGMMEDVMRSVEARITRVDIAVDIETDTTPTEFVQEKNHKRMRAHGTQISSTGETCYVGSQASDRYCRVYRFNPPHPRAHLLRVEYVFRKDYAKAICRGLLDGGIMAVTKSSGEAFGFTHVAWEMDAGKSVDISIISPSRSAGSTVHWLITSCAPAFRRLVESGDIRDPDEFIRRYFYST